VVVLVNGSVVNDHIDMISVIMVDGGFRERFHLLDFLNKQTLPRERYELLWVEYYDEVHPDLVSRIDVDVITLGHRKGVDPYRSACCFNEGIRRSRGELLVILDADQVVEPDLLETVLREHEMTDRLVMYVMRWDEPAEKHREQIDVEHLRRVSTIRNPVNYGGCLTVRRKWFVDVNGYDLDPVFTGLHAHGRDLWIRFKNLGLYVMWHPSQRIYHPWHPHTLFNEPGTYDEQLKLISWRAKHLVVKANEGTDVFAGPDALAAPAPQSVGGVS
jgi:GT2 family glycosyltransferase